MYVVYERRATDFTAQKLQKGRSETADFFPVVYLVTLTALSEKQEQQEKREPTNQLQLRNFFSFKPSI